MYYLLLDTMLETMQKHQREIAHPTAEHQQLCSDLVERREQAEQITVVRFFVDPILIQYDYLPVRNTSGGRLGSQRFLDLLREEAVPFLAYPAHFVDRTSNDTLDQSHFFFIPRRMKTRLIWSAPSPCSSLRKQGVVNCLRLY